MLILWILLGLLCILLVLFAVAFVRALLMRAAAPAGVPPAVDDEAAQRYARHLSRLVQCPTVNAPGLDPADTRDAFTRLYETLANCYPLCFSRLERVDLPDALLLRWPGADASRDALLLLAHSDVVTAEGEWTHPPFAGEIADGRIWGRGAMDTKDTLCALFEATEALLRKGHIPPCDVWLGSSRNEETMGPGAVQIKEYLAKRGTKLALVLDEGGSVVGPPLPGLQGRFAMLGLVEKGYANLRFVAKSGGGHASTPPRNSPLARLAAFVHEMETHPPFKNEISGPTRQMLAALAPHMRLRWCFLFGNLWLFGPLLVRLLPGISPQAAAMLHTTCAFTMASGSSLPNVLPETASVTANLRFALHQPMAPSLEAVRRVADRYGLTMEVLYSNDVFPAVDTDGEAYRFLLGCVQSSFPEAVCAPFTVLFGTDSRHFAEDCRCVLRFSPVTLGADQLKAMHGLNESLDVEALYRAVGFYRTLLESYR